MKTSNRSTSIHSRNSLRRACGFIAAAGSLFAVAQVAHAFTVSKVTGFSTDHRRPDRRRQSGRNHLQREHGQRKHRREHRV